MLRRVHAIHPVLPLSLPRLDTEYVAMQSVQSGPGLPAKELKENVND